MRTLVRITGVRGVFKVFNGLYGYTYSMTPSPENNNKILVVLPDMPCFPEIGIGRWIQKGFKLKNVEICERKAIK